MEKQSMRTSLVKNIEAELTKDADDIDPGFIDRAIDQLYALDGLSPPTLSDAALAAAARTIRSRSAWRRRNILTAGVRKRRFTRRVLRGAWAVCCAILILFSVNYAAALTTGSCLPSTVGLHLG
jgi:hypothetical protein